jgi:hypothetical protein
MNDHPALACEAPDHPVSTPADLQSVFAELVCADPGLLQAEFDALIAANFPPGNGRRSRHPPRRSAPPGTDRARPTPQAVSASRSGPRSGSAGGIGTDRAARERGPPRQHARTRIGQESKPATRR